MNKRTAFYKLGLVAIATLLLSALQAGAWAAGGGHGGGGGGGHGGFGGGAHAAFGGGFARGGFARGGFARGGFARGGFGRGGYGRAGIGYGRGWHGYGWRGYGYGWGPGWGWGLGLYLPVLPFYYSTYWWDGVPYYYADDAYYQWDGTVGEYQQVQPPAELAQQAGGPPGGGAQPGPAASTELFAYPKNGQSEQQQAADKSACRSWARSQVGLTPASGDASPAAGTAEDGSAVGALQAATGNAPAGTAPPSAGDDTNSSAAGEAPTHALYLRAEAACLRGRGYSVQ